MIMQLSSYVQEKVDVNVAKLLRLSIYRCLEKSFYNTGCIPNLNRRYPYETVCILKASMDHP